MVYFILPFSRSFWKLPGKWCIPVYCISPEADDNVRRSPYRQDETEVFRLTLKPWLKVMDRIMVTTPACLQSKIKQAYCDSPCDVYYHFF